MSKVGRLSLLLFYLLLLFLPIQLGRHFFWDFTTISGIRSDYLAPTIYLTDIIAFFLIVTSSRGTKRGLQNDNKYVYLLSVICYLLFNVMFIATNKWAAFYKLIKILEYIFLGIAISRLKPKATAIAIILSISVFYSSAIAIWQFLIQRSVGGIFWWLGERIFYAGTPGIAAFSYKGSLLLRPYATFPHPNVLGGFLAIVLPLIFFYSSSEEVPDGTSESRRLINNSSRPACAGRRARTIKRIWLIFCLMVGLTTLILTFSRTAWAVAGIGFFLLITGRLWPFKGKIKTSQKLIVPLFYFLIFLSVLIPIFLPQAFLAKNQYWQERVILLKTAITMISGNLMFGVGLNNSITQLKNFINYFPGIFIFQPVHNIFLLILSETGIVGFGFFLWGGIKIFKSYVIYPVIIFQLFLLGLFDHYLYTLQQGQLLLTVFMALALPFRPSKARGMIKRILSF